MIGISGTKSPSFSVLAGMLCFCASGPALADKLSSANSVLDRVAYAVEGAESSHGRDLSMWRGLMPGPQGPMQVSEKAAIDVGGGDRFEAAENRAIGRAYLALLFRRYGNWADAISAYNWGLGKVDSWIRAGQRPNDLASGVLIYLRRVLHDSGLCDDAEAAADACGSQGWSADVAVTRPSRKRSGIRGYHPLDQALAKAERLAVEFGSNPTR